MDALKDFYDFYRPLQRRYDLRMFYKTNDRQKAYMETHRDDKAYERFKHMPDYGKGVSNNDK